MSCSSTLQAGIIFAIRSGAVRGCAPPGPSRRLRFPSVGKNLDHDHERSRRTCLERRRDIYDAKGRQGCRLALVDAGLAPHARGQHGDHGRAGPYAPAQHRRRSLPAARHSRPWRPFSTVGRRSSWRFQAMSSAGGGPGSEQSRRSWSNRDRMDRLPLPAIFQTAPPRRAPDRRTAAPPSPSPPPAALSPAPASVPNGHGRRRATGRPGPGRGR